MLRNQTTPKIAYAVSAAWTFIQSLHREGVDRGLIATLGDRFEIQSDFTTSTSQLATTLNAIAQGVKDEGTRLYDSIQDIITTFWSAGRRDCPWVLLIVTDGDDNRSKNYPCNKPQSPEMIGRYVGTRFNHERTNFPFLIGVGQDQQINARALATIGHYGQFPAVRIEAFPHLQRVFQQIAVRVTSDLERFYVPTPYGAIQGVRENVRLTRQPIDYAILLDVSLSMGHPA